MRTPQLTVATMSEASCVVKRTGVSCRPNSGEQQMDETPDGISMIDRLCRKGDPRDTWRWHEGDPDYVNEFALQPEHILTLIEIAQNWAENDELPEDGWAAPVHAWRAVAQLRAMEIVAPLLAMQNRLDEMGDQWYLEEFHDVFDLIGARAIPALHAYLADSQNAEFPRISAANGLCEIGKRHPEAHSQVVEILENQLAKHEPNAYSLNGFLVGYLTDLKATESAETIERTFASGTVDETVSGG